MSSGAMLPDDVLAAAASLVCRRTGLVFSAPRRAAFATGLQAAMRRSGEKDPDAYLTRMEVEPALLDDLVAEITVGETYFLREAGQVAVLRNDILPALLAERPRPLRVWSAGCATGEEPYTLAMLLQELGAAGRAHIIGTDLSRAALDRARQGRYGRWSLRGVPDAVVQTYFALAGKEFTLAAAIRGAVEFRYLNLAEDTYPSLPTGIWGMDLILCRNVLIYFDRETVTRVAQRLIDSLAPDGWLLLGSSDPMLTDLVPCEVVVTSAGLAYRRAGLRTPFPVAGRVPAAPPGPVWEPVPKPPAAPRELAPAQPVETPPPLSPPVPADPAEAVRCYAALDYGRAAELAAALVGHDGADPELWVVLVRALANRGELDAAGRACAAALDRHRTSAELTYLHAVLLAEADRHADAASAARRALYLDRRLVVAHLVLASALTRLGERDGARRAYGNAERLLAAMAPHEIVPASDGEPAGRLTEMARVQLRLLQGAAA